MSKIPIAGFDGDPDNAWFTALSKYSRETFDK